MGPSSSEWAISQPRRLAAKVTPSPARSQGVQRDALGPRSQDRRRPGLAAGNSNLKLGTLPGPVIQVHTSTSPTNLTPRDLPRASPCNDDGRFV